MVMICRRMSVRQQRRRIRKSIGEAVKDAKSGDTIKLAEGNYSLYDVCGKNGASNSEEYTKKKNLTFEGQGVDKTNWYIGANPTPEGFNGEYDGDYCFDGAKTITFKNLTLQAGSKDYLGFIRADNTVVDACVVNGMTTYWGYESAVFKNTTFNCPNNYAIHAYSSHDMLIEKCIFEDAKGKAVKIYNESGGTSINLTFKDNTVISKKEKYAVINIDDRFTNFTVDIIGHNSISGPAKVDTGTCSRLFGFSNGSCNTGKTIVNFGNTTVWQNGEMVNAKAYHNSGVTANGVTYNNHVDGSNNSLYAEGYKDNVFTTTTTGEWTTNNDSTISRTVTKKCTYCGYEEKVTEYRVTYYYSNGTAKPTDSPKTGDTSNLTLWIALLLANGGAVTATTIYGRKNKRSVK